MSKQVNRPGMTLVEVLLVVTIIGMLAAFLVPAIQSAIRNRENAQAASKLRMLISVFELYKSENGSYPGNVSRGVVPVGMADYFANLNINWFTQATPLGGQWNWGKGGYAAAVAIESPSVSRSQMTEFDQRIDDGNLSTGKFKRDDDSYIYIIKP